MERSWARRPGVPRTGLGDSRFPELFSRWPQAMSSRRSTIASWSAWQASVGPGRRDAWAISFSPATIGFHEPRWLPSISKLPNRRANRLLMANKRSTAYFFLEGLVDLGIEYVSPNLVTDRVSLIEAMAEWRAEGRRHPEVVLCPHENVAIHMAGGYAAATRRGQAGLVHGDAGTANAAMGMQNLCRARLPVLLLAGKAPFSLRGELPASRDNYVHFVQDPFDIGSLVRPYVKWEYNLPTGLIGKEVLRRGHAMMQSDPPGPVYLTLPREVLAEGWPADRVQAFPAERYGAVTAGGVDPARLQPLVDRLLAARAPMVVSSYLGRKAEAVHALREL